MLLSLFGFAAGCAAVALPAAAGPHVLGAVPPFESARRRGLYKESGRSQSALAD